MHLTAAHISPIVALVAGILILIAPRLLNYVVAIYLIVVGLVGPNGIYHFMKWDEGRWARSNPMSMPHDQRVTEIGTALANAVRRHSTLFLAEGIILVLLGALAIFVPLFATITVTIILGWIFLAAGIMGLITTFRARQAPGFWWSLLSAIIAVGVGLILLAEPITGAVSLTLVLIVFFVVEGVATIMYALEHRRELSGRWEWMLISGIIDLVLAGIIFAGLPGTAAWALGLLVGINMVFGGVALVAIALHARSSALAS
jgi:uncharacterized membrane protein HdeD (DUF308 family)